MKGGINLLNINNALPQVIKKYRKLSSMSQEELSLKCNLDRSFISLIERGKRMPTLHTIFLISQALNVKPSQLIKEVEQLVYEDSKNSNSNR